MSAPLSPREEQRIVKLLSYNILDTEPETAYDDLTQLAAYICQTPIALVSLVDSERQCFKSAVGLTVKETHRDWAFCAHAILQPDGLIVPDARADDRFADNPLVTGEPHIRFYAGMPLITADDLALGTLCVIDTQPRNLSSEQICALQCLSRQVMSQLELRLNHQKLLQEVQQRQEAEIRLQDSHKFLDRIINSTTDLIFAKNLQGTHLLVNTAFAEVFARSIDQIIGQNDFSLFPAAIAEKIQNDDRSVLESGMSRTYEEEILICGQPRKYSTTKAPIYNTAGNAVGIVGIARDISERNRIEADRRQIAMNLQLSEERYRSLTVAIAQIVWTTDPNGLTIDIPEWRTYTGQTVDEVRGLGWLAAVHPEDQDRTAEQWVLAVQAKKPFGTEYRIRGKDGNYRYFAIRAVPVLNSDGSIREWVGICTDIDDRKQIEAELHQALHEAEHQSRLLKTVLDASQDLIYVKDRNYRYTLVNYSYAKALGKPVAAILGKDDLELGYPKEQIFGDPEQGIRGFRHDDQIALAGEVVHNIADQATLAEGLVRVFDTRKTPLYDAKGEIFAMLGCSRDLTERHHTEAALRRSETQLKEQAAQLEQTLRELRHTQSQMIQAEKMSSLGQLVAGIAHEINNPVNFIYGNISPATAYAQDLLHLLGCYQQHYPNVDAALIREIEAVDLDFIREDLPKLLASMKEGADRIRQIVLSLRNFSRMDEAECKTVDIHEGIDSTLMILQNRLKVKPHWAGIEVVKIYDQLPLIECYAGQLNQVFLNIITNAIDSLEEAESNNTQLRPRIQISTQLIAPGLIRISFLDNGLGIPKTIQNRLFDPFFTTKPVGKGTGMGMAISYQIITEKHRGKLYYRSSPGQGAEFVIEIPTQQQEPYL